MKGKIPHWTNVVIMGAGESGQGAALLGHKLGYNVFLSEGKKIENSVRDFLVQSGITVEEERHSIDKFLEADVVVVSPGIPDAHPVLLKCQETSIPVISEIEWASLHSEAQLIAITGTNGKTTTTALIYHVLEKAGLNVGLAGNIGKSFARALLDGDKQFFVLEVSSFQLDGCFSFKPFIAVITNITPDHLDRYNYDYKLYLKSKMRIFQNQSEYDHLVVCNDSPDLVNALSGYHIVPQIHWFGNALNPASEAYFDQEKIILKMNSQETMNIYLEELALQGRHNYYNSLAAAIAAKILNIRKEIIKESFMDFKGVPHRMEFVASVKGIEFINDSKATNVNSAFYALESMTKPVIWIAGGRDKGNDYSELKPIVAEKVKAIIVLGEGFNKIYNAFEGSVNSIIQVTNMAEAVKTAYQIGEKGDLVLLSPASASFDLFKNYEDRGNQFKFFVREL